MAAVMKLEPIAYDDGIISKAKTARGLLVWAFEAASRSGITTSRFWPRIDGLRRSFSRLDAVTEAAWIIGCIKTLAVHQRAVIAANYGHDHGQQATLIEMLAKLEPDLAKALIVCTVTQWCGVDLSLIQMRRLTGLTERAVRDGREVLREYLLRWDESAITRLQYAFESRGWLEA